MYSGHQSASPIWSSPLPFFRRLFDPTFSRFYEKTPHAGPTNLAKPQNGKTGQILDPKIWGGTPPFLAKNGGVPPRKIRGGTPPFFGDFGPKIPKKGPKKAKKGPKMAKNDHFLTSRGTSGNGGPRASRAGAAHPPFF